MLEPASPQPTTSAPPMGAPPMGGPPMTAPTAGASKPRQPMSPPLEQAKAAVMQKLPPELKTPVEAIVTAGLKILYDQTTHAQYVEPIYQRLQKTGFKPRDIAVGILNLISMVSKASGGKAQPAAMLPAAIILATYVLDDLQKLYGLTVTDDLVNQVNGKMTAVFKVGANVLQQQKAQPAPPAAPPMGAAGPQGLMDRAGG